MIVVDSDFTSADPWGLPVDDQAEAEIDEREDAQEGPLVQLDSEQSEDGEPDAEPEPELPVASQPNPAARNVLDALGVGLDDLPDEPPAWIEEPTDTDDTDDTD
ncbi:MAG: hypothetical protein GWP04_04830, partial [Gammaproteobacteria bacterium]|nr:hypothetical protein [Gammaproteobacteria bacterium]